MSINSFYYNDMTTAIFGWFTHLPRAFAGIALLLGVSNAAHAVFIEASAANPFPRITVKVGVTGTVCAFSEVNLVAHSKTKKPPTSCMFRLLTKPPAEVAGLLDGIGTRNFAKNPPTTETAVSESEFEGSTARAVADLSSFDTSAPPDGTADKATLFGVSAVAGKDYRPRAASRTVDPFSIPAGVHDYEVIIDSISLTALVADGGEGEAYVAFAGASDVHGDLWDLALSLSTNGAFGMSFASDPLLVLDDALVTSSLLAALDFSVPGTVSLAGPYSLFRSSLSSDVEFLLDQKLATAAVGNSVSEPGALWVVSLGLILVIAGRGNVRRDRTAHCASELVTPTA